MNGFTFDSINSARALAEIERAERELERENARKEAQRNLPVVEGLNGIIGEMQEQNKLLEKQVEEAQKESEEARKEARKAKYFSWISFAITALIALASLIVSIVK